VTKLSNQIDSLLNESYEDSDSGNSKLPTPWPVVVTHSNVATFHFETLAELEKEHIEQVLSMLMAINLKQL
jgi:hypothetical protein